jgi:hypothetical protein
MSRLRMTTLAAAAAAALMASGSVARAATLTEDFEAVPFSTWETNWFGVNSNAVNFYVMFFGPANHDNRGYNKDGIFLTDGNAGDDLTINIVFDAGFASTLTFFSIDVASYVTGGTLDFFDRAGAIISTQLVIPTSGADTEPGIYNTYFVNSSNGIGGFRFNTGDYESEGNVSVDNLIARTDVSTVPVPAALPLLLSGLGVMGLLGWRRKRG